MVTFIPTLELYMVHVLGELMLSQGRGQHKDNTHTEEMLLQMLNVLREHRR